MTAPTLHLRSAAWVNARRRKGEPLSGPQLSIQRAPRGQYGECGDGFVEILRPTIEEWELGRVLVADRRTGTPDPHALAAYRGSMEARWERALRMGQLRPGRLAYHSIRGGMGFGGMPSEVPDGAILTCSCAAGAECHRRWLAPFTARAGWTVTLDGSCP